MSTHPSLRSPCPAGSVGGEGQGPWWPPPQGHSLISSRKGQAGQLQEEEMPGTLGRLRGWCQCQPTGSHGPRASSPRNLHSGVWGVGGRERGLGQGNPRVSPPLLFPNLLGASPPSSEGTPPRPQPQAPRSNAHCSRASI